jgi:hypothetical protein
MVPIMKKHGRDIFSSITLITLSLVSVLLIIDNAGAEPFVTFRNLDAIEHIGGASVLLVLWFQFGFWIVAQMFRKKISFWWAPVLPWAALACFYILHCPFAYVEDISKFAIQPH